METQPYRETAKLLIGLITDYLCPDPSFSPAPPNDPDALYALAKHHQITALTAAALQKHGFATDAFVIAQAKAKQRTILYKRELQILSEEFEKCRIPYMPLKGMSLTDLYPMPWLREMSDIDILIKPEDQQRVRDIMLRQKYVIKHYDKTNHDVYHKAPFFIVEIHRSLFNKMDQPQLWRYFEEKINFDGQDDALCRRMPTSQTYIYLVAHAYNHFSIAGTGLRTLIDIYLFLKRYRQELDFEAISYDLKKISLDGYEKSVRELSEKLFQHGVLSENDIKDLDYYIESGVYGSEKLMVRNRVAQYYDAHPHKSKLRYAMHRLKPTAEIAQVHPFYSKHPSLLPLLGVTRLASAIIKPKSTLKEIKELKRYKS